MPILIHPPFCIWLGFYAGSVFVLRVQMPVRVRYRIESFAL